MLRNVFPVSNMGLESLLSLNFNLVWPQESSHRRNTFSSIHSGARRHVFKPEVPKAVRAHAMCCTDAESLGLFHQDLGPANRRPSRPLKRSQTSLAPLSGPYISIKHGHFFPDIARLPP
jgi:hypothetical protein